MGGRVYVAVIILVTLFVRKHCFITPDGVCITLLHEDLAEVYKETFIYANLYTSNRSNVITKSTNKVFLMFLLLCCGDIETCPGPASLTGNEFSNFLKSKGMSIVHQNITGLLSNFHSLQELLFSHENVNILTLSETHIIDDTFNDNNNLYEIPGYSFITRNRVAGKGGGVAMSLKDTISWKRREDIECDDLENIWVEISLNNENFSCVMLLPASRRINLS